MPNIIKSIRESIITDPDFLPLVWDRVDWLRSREWEDQPFIVYTEWRFQNLWDGKVGDGWPDHCPIIFDIVVKREDSMIGRRIRALLIKKFNGFHGVLTTDRSGNIGWIENMETLYNAETDQVSWQIEFLFKGKM